MIAQNIQVIEDKITKAAQKVGRKREDITLIAVSKTYPKEAVIEAYEAGAMHFGENKVQELIGKVEAIALPINWHLIGHLQTNKVKYIVDKVTLIHSVDSIKLAEEISKQATKKQVLVPILLEVNVAKEASKHGFLVEDVIDTIKFIEIGRAHV